MRPGPQDLILSNQPYFALARDWQPKAGLYAGAEGWLLGTGGLLVFGQSIRGGIGPKAPLEFEVEGETRNFLRKYIGDSEEYTATYP